MQTKFHIQNLLDNAGVVYELRNPYTPFCVDHLFRWSSACNSFIIVSALLHDGEICRWFQFPWWEGGGVCDAIAF